MSINWTPCKDALPDCGRVIIFYCLEHDGEICASVGEFRKNWFDGGGDAFVDGPMSRTALPVESCDAWAYVTLMECHQ